MTAPSNHSYAVGQHHGQSRLPGTIFGSFSGALSKAFGSFFRTGRPPLYYNEGGGRICKGKSMKGLLFLVAVAVLLGPLPAAARDGGFSPFLQVQDRGEYRRKGEFRRGGQDFRREKQGRPPRDERYRGRMTEEERRELHRDLDRAEREIYRRNPPR